MGGIYALIAIGIHLVYNATRVINFSQGSLVQLGGVIALSLLLQIKIPMVFAFTLTFLLAGFLGWVYEKTTIRKASHHGEISVILVTIGGFIFFEQIIHVFWGKDEMAFPTLSGEIPIELAGVRILPQSLWVIGIALLIVIVLHLFFSRTIFGSAILATAENPVAAKLMGIRPTSVTAASWAISTAIASIAGILIAPITFAGGTMAAEISLKGFAAAILGGIGSSWGVVLGGFLIGLLEALTTGYISSAYRDAITFTLMLLVLLSKPSGIMGTALVKKV